MTPKRPSASELAAVWLDEAGVGNRAQVDTERFNIHVARLIATKRQEAGLTQAELASKVGTTQSVISRLESADYSGHSLSMLDRIARVLGQDLRVTIGPSVEPSSKDDLRLAFRAILRHLRRGTGLSVADLSIKTELPIAELEGLEQGSIYPPRPLTLYKLSSFFAVSQRRLAVLAGVIRDDAENTEHVASRFAANSHAFSKMSEDERRLFDEFVRYLRTRNETGT